MSAAISLATVYLIKYSPCPVLDTPQVALSANVPAPIITASLLARIASRDTDSFSMKTIAALRNQFGGHAVKKKADD